MPSFQDTIFPDAAPLHDVQAQRRHRDDCKEPGMQLWASEFAMCNLTMRVNNFKFSL